MLQAQQRSALRTAVLERRLQATGQELAALSLLSTAGAPGAMGKANAAEADEQSMGRRACSAATQEDTSASEQGSGQDSEQEAATGGRSSSGSNWATARLDVALHTPLPDEDTELLEDEGAPEVEEQIAQLAAAADTAEAPKAQAGKTASPGHSPLAALEAQLSQAALGAQEAAELAARDN